jgi:hypothetical protein
MEKEGQQVWEVCESQEESTKKKLMGLDERTLGEEEFMRIAREIERRRHVFGVAVRKDLVEKGNGIQSGDEWTKL